MAKSKKAKKAADNASPAQVEAQEANEEAVPATIVESTEEKVFSSQEETLEAEPTVEKPAQKPRVSKRPYIADVEILLSAGTHTKKAMLEFIMEKYPQVSKGGASTFLTDLLNPKYSHWKERSVVKTPTGKLVFKDRLEAPGNDLQPVAESSEQPAE